MFFDYGREKHTKELLDLVEKHGGIVSLNLYIEISEISILLNGFLKPGK
jgi:hypothetical protein